MSRLSNLPPGVTEWMIPGNEDFDPWETDEDFVHKACGFHLDQHHEESYEDSYGNDYEGYRCPPEGLSNQEADHFGATGCADLDPQTEPSDGSVYCASCGKDYGPESL